MRSNASERVRVHINEHKSHLGVSAHKCKSATYLLPNSFKSRSWRDDFATVNSHQLVSRSRFGTDQLIWTWRSVLTSIQVLMADHSS
jgi:hypothetical protein